MSALIQGASIIVESLPSLTTQEPETLAAFKVQAAYVNEYKTKRWDRARGCYVESETDTWWTVGVSVREIVEDTTVNRAVVPDVGAFPALGAANPRSSLLVYLSTRTAYGSQEVELDLGGGGRWSVFGRTVSVSVAGPSARSVQPGQPSLVSPTVAFSQIITSLNASKRPVGDRHGRLTQRVFVPANTDGFLVRIPAWVTDVQITEGTAALQPPSNSEWIMLDRNRVGALDRPGRIPLVLGLSPVVTLPGYITFFQLSAAAPFDRTYSFSYDVRWW